MEDIECPNRLLCEELSLLKRLLPSANLTGHPHEQIPLLNTSNTHNGNGVSHYQDMNRHRVHDSNISHGLNPQQPLNLQNGHTLGAEQPVCAHRGHSCDTSLPVATHNTHVFSAQQPLNAHSGQGLNPLQPVSLQNDIQSVLDNQCVLKKGIALIYHIQWLLMIHLFAVCYNHEYS